MYFYIGDLAIFMLVFVNDRMYMHDPVRPMRLSAYTGDIICVTLCLLHDMNFVQHFVPNPITNNLYILLESGHYSDDRLKLYNS